MEEVRKFLEDLGIHFGLLIAGLFGAFVNISSEKELNVWQKWSAVASGAFTANYLTPLVFHYIKLGDSAKFGFAFLIGFLGLKFVEWIIVLLKKKYENKN